MSELEVGRAQRWRQSRLGWLILGLLFIAAGILGLRSGREADSQPEAEFLSPRVAVEPAVASPESAAPRAEVLPTDYSSIPVDLLADSRTRPARAPKEQADAGTTSKSYVVQPGDSLWTIAKAFNVDMGTLVEANGLKKNRYLRAGQTLLIPPGSGIYYRVRAGESLWEICQRYQVNLQKVLTQNRILQANLIQVGQQLFLPGASAKRAVTDLIWPVRGRLTSRFGMRQHPMGGGRKMHNGVDIAAPVGRLIRAAQSGKVTAAGSRGKLGRVVILQHADKYQTVYGHNSKILVEVGQNVQQGQAIARVGSTGVSTGPHSHFELRKAGRAIDPLPYLP